MIWTGVCQWCAKRKLKTVMVPVEPWYIRMLSGSGWECNDCADRLMLGRLRRVVNGD